MAKVKKTSKPATDATVKRKTKSFPYDFVFSRQKYIIMLVGLIFIFVGFLLMIGGGTDDPNEFSYELFSFRRMTLAPILVLLGYCIEIYAIMKKDKPESDAVENEIKQ